MYLMKAKKQFSEKDAKELEEKQEKYILRTQNRQSGRQAKDSNVEGDDVKNKEELLQPDDLPDGAHLRPRNVLAAANLDIDDQAVIKAAQYIGSFPVVGCDQSDRARYVISQLENMRNVSKTKNVLLVISLSGIKVCSQSGDSVYMAHALKRISYATCDPEHSQFSFLARDPKGCIDVQFCHAFVTQKQEEAEELNAIIGNAFKMAYAKERDKQPTFHELIQLQLEDQKVKYQEYEQEAKRVFQQKLTEIATPTPFSDKALQRMEMRRQSSSNDDMPPETPEREFIVGKNKLWAKYNVEKVQHRSPVAEIASVSPIRHSTSSAMSSDSAENNREIDEALRRNSTPVSVSSVSTLDRNTNNRAVNPLSVQAIKESFVFNSNSNKLKGSPVTALKDEIDKRLSYIPNSARLDDYDPANRSSRSGRGSVSSISSDVSNSSDTQRKLEDEKDKFSKMQNRPLPAVPIDRDGQGSPRTYSSQHSWSSCSTDSLTQPDSPVPSVFVPLRSSGNPESPRKKSNRPLSGFMQTDVIRCSLFQDPAKHSQSNGNEHSSSSSSPIIPREALSDNQIADTQSNITTSPNISQNTPQEGSAYIYGPPRKSIDNQMKGPQRSESSPSCEQVLRYQNDSPFHYQSPSMDVEENQYENKLGMPRPKRQTRRATQSRLAEQTAVSSARVSLVDGLSHLYSIPVTARSSACDTVSSIAPPSILRTSQRRRTPSSRARTVPATSFQTSVACDSDIPASSFSFHNAVTTVTSASDTSHSPYAYSRPFTSTVQTLDGTDSTLVFPEFVAQPALDTQQFRETFPVTSSGSMTDITHLLREPTCASHMDTRRTGQPPPTGLTHNIDINAYPNEPVPDTMRQTLNNFSDSMPPTTPMTRGGICSVSTSFEERLPIYSVASRPNVGLSTPEPPRPVSTPSTARQTLIEQLQSTIDLLRRAEAVQSGDPQIGQNTGSDAGDTGAPLVFPSINVPQGSTVLGLSGLTHPSGLAATSVHPQVRLPTPGVSNQFVSASVPLDGMVSLSTKQKIWAEEFVDLSGLLPMNAGQTRYTLAMDPSDPDTPSLQCIPQTTKTISLLPQWLTAFEIYMAIYLTKFPHLAPQLLKYQSTIRLLESEGGNWLFYDQHFRSLRQFDPSLPWDFVHSELWLKASRNAWSQSKATHQSGQHRYNNSKSRAVSYPKGYCHRYHGGNSCTAPCKFSHSCFACDQDHSFAKCPNRSEWFKSPFRAGYGRRAAAKFGPRGQSFNNSRRK